MTQAPLVSEDRLAPAGGSGDHLGGEGAAGDIGAAGGAGGARQ